MIIRVAMLLWVLLLLGGALAGCRSSGATRGKNEPGPMETSAVRDGVADPAWLREPFYKRFPEHRDMVDGGLQVIRVNLDEDAEPEHFAWLSLDRLNGLGILFDGKPGAYRSAYETDHPVYYAGFDRDSRSLIIAAGAGGTGLQQNWFHVIRKVNGSFSEVWSGIERSRLSVTPPFTERYGSVMITSGAEEGDGLVLRHITRYALLDERNRPLESGSAIDMYVFRPDQGRFVPVRDVPGVGKHLVLDRPETFGGAVFVRVVGLPPDDLQAVDVKLVGPAGDELASGEWVEADQFVLGPPLRLPWGTYTVQLEQRNGGNKVLDRVSLVVRERMGGSTR